MSRMSVEDMCRVEQSVYILGISPDPYIMLERYIDYAERAGDDVLHVHTIMWDLTENISLYLEVAYRETLARIRVNTATPADWRTLLTLPVFFYRGVCMTLL